MALLHFVMPVAVKLIPFQILYKVGTNDDSESTNTDVVPVVVDEMQVLAITRHHLIEYEFSHHSDFLSLALYQAVRQHSYSNTSTGNNNDNNLLIAYTGTVTYLSNNNNDGDAQLVDQDVMYVSFLGSNGTIYINMLQQQAGWTTLQEIELMTMQGNYITMSENGTTTTTNDTEGTDPTTLSSSSSEMNIHMQTYIYLIAVGVPVGIVFLCGLGYIIYMLKYHVQYTNKPKHDHPTWVVHTNNHVNGTQSSSVRKQKRSNRPTTSQLVIRSSHTLDFTNILHDATTNSDELTLDETIRVVGVEEHVNGDAQKKTRKNQRSSSQRQKRSLVEV